MDPDATLASLIEKLDALSVTAENFETTDSDDVAEAIEEFRALDQWLRGGGFKPEAWA